VLLQALKVKSKSLPKLAELQVGYWTSLNLNKYVASRFLKRVRAQQCRRDLLDDARASVAIFRDADLAVKISTCGPAISVAEQTRK
jgi:hypothetical protein